MPGSIRFIAGMLVVWGTVGAMDSATDTQLAALAVLAVAGLYSMYSGARAMKSYS
jgi:hypothetical protein